MWKAFKRTSISGPATELEMREVREGKKGGGGGGGGGGEEDMTGLI